MTRTGFTFGGTFNFSIGTFFSLAQDICLQNSLFPRIDLGSSLIGKKVVEIQTMVSARNQTTNYEIGGYVRSALFQTGTPNGPNVMYQGNDYVSCSPVQKETLILDDGKPMTPFIFDGLMQMQNCVVELGTTPSNVANKNFVVEVTFVFVFED